MAERQAAGSRTPYTFYRAPARADGAHSRENVGLGRARRPHLRGEQVVQKREEDEEGEEMVGQRRPDADQ
eukprot:439961-Prorocentrum_minimum.AAC.1